MEIFRYTRDVYDQPALMGMSWDLVWLFFGAAAAVVVIHAIYMAVSGSSKSRA
jgi:hypothetical protein